jgi:lysylphosphatidylglycerol synthetase-like protein (DUF2156 family)
MTFADDNPFAPEVSWESGPVVGISEVSRRHHRHIVRWFLSTWVGTGVAGGLFGGLILVAGGPAAVVMGLIFGFLFAIIAGLVVSAVGLLLVLLLRTHLNEYSLRLWMAVLCGGGSGCLCTISSGSPSFILPAVFFGAIVPWLLVFLDSRHPPLPD